MRRAARRSRVLIEMNASFVHSATPLSNEMLQRVKGISDIILSHEQPSVEQIDCAVRVLRSVETSSHDLEMFIGSLRLHQVFELQLLLCGVHVPARQYVCNSRR